MIAKAYLLPVSSVAQEYPFRGKKKKKKKNKNGKKWFEEDENSCSHHVGGLDKVPTINPTAGAREDDQS